ncbi:DsbA family protein [Ideonella azotifigens]|uniref:Disulfide reductase DsbM n=1 Tax=Ideonella azotifigens TaxID=513160 RepID=A0ABN1KGV9_9BURK|nr:DsbA family protein [Ideonella azotifigens]MCD2340322.1 DsbA family protein [Ideonella azotifigens]
MTAILHYVYDPLCGWCYGAAPLVKAARDVVDVKAHGGGMMTGARRQAVTPQLRGFVMPHDARIAQLSGQPFGDAYANGLLRDTTAVFDSEPPTAAILAAEALAGRGLDLLAALQVAHYVEGRRIADRAVLIDVAGAIGLPPAPFADALDRQTGAAVQAHFEATRSLMAQVGAQGFPSFVLDIGGVMTRVDASRHLGRPQEFQDWLREQTPPTAISAGHRFACDADGCAL